MRPSASLLCLLVGVVLAPRMVDGPGRVRSNDGTPPLVSIPSPDGSGRAERRATADGWRGVRVDRTGRIMADFGPDIHPLGWSTTGESLLAVRLTDDGHDLVTVEPVVIDSHGVVQPNPGGPGEPEWVRLYLGCGPAPPARPAGPGSSGPAARAAAVPMAVAVDPGHGGPGAGQWTGNNGDGGGAVGPGGLTEQWVNLRVSELLMEWLDHDPRFAGSFRTRTSSTQAVSLPDRVALAARHDAALLVSIHHNGLPAGTPNRTESYWCRRNTGCGDEAACSRPARELHDAVVAAFHYPGHGALEDSSGTGLFHFYVLRYALRPAALVEASSITGDSGEEWRFGHDPFEQHARDEARAIYSGILGWCGFSTAASPESLSVLPAPVTLGEPRSGPGGSIVVSIERRGNSGDLTLELTDLHGRRLRVDRFGAAVRSITWRWNGRNGAGGRIAAGLYWLVARQNDRIVASRRLTWLP